ncbi:uncharacterized protein LOC113503958 [Trichoplusia ni]|uniref:Odorant receptor n=1 Tax=Trichoplusia ni TaxID=7111 RepID=A0A7E5WMF1_TRINI|nr:uncharacterized protein LOC113503958 [Trichoplusia ni]
MWEKVRKFGLGYCDLPTMMWNVSVFLRLFTVNIDSKYKKGIPIFVYVAVTLSSICYYYIYLFSMLWFVFVICPQTGQTLEAMWALSLGVPSEIGTLRLFYMKLQMQFCSRDQIRSLTDDLLEFDSKTLPDHRRSRNVLKHLRDVKKRAIVLWLVIVGTGFMFIIKHFIAPEHLTDDTFAPYGFGSMEESPNYEIVAAMMAVCVTFINGFSGNMTAYIIIITGYVEAQMLAVSHELENIWKDAQDHFRTTRNLEIEINKDEAKKQRILNQYVSDRLKVIIAQHATLKQFYLKVRDVLKGFLGIAFFVLIAGLLFNLLGGLRNTYMHLPFVFLQIAMDCFIGQRMKDAGIVFSRAVYACGWENFDKNNMRMVLIMLQNSQRITVLSAGSFVNVNYKCLMATIKGSYSSYTTFESSVNK